MDALMVCQICQDFFDLEEKFPLMVDCGNDHTYCKSCLTSVFKPKDGFKCFVCEGTSHTPIAKLRENEFVTSFLREELIELYGKCEIH